MTSTGTLHLHLHTGPMTRSAFGFDDKGDDWRDYAACRGLDPDMWELAPGYRHSGLYQTAHRICDGCHVKAECLAFAKENGACGMIFGGVDFDFRPERPDRPLAVVQSRQCEREACRVEFQSACVNVRFCSMRCQTLTAGERQNRRGRARGTAA